MNMSLETLELRGEDTDPGVILRFCRRWVGSRYNEDIQSTGLNEAPDSGKQQ